MLAHKFLDPRSRGVGVQTRNLGVKVSPFVGLSEVGDIAFDLTQVKGGVSAF